MRRLPTASRRTSRTVSAATPRVKLFPLQGTRAGSVPLGSGTGFSACWGGRHARSAGGRTLAPWTEVHPTGRQLLISRLREAHRAVQS